MSWCCGSSKPPQVELPVKIEKEKPLSVAVPVASKPITLQMTIPRANLASIPENALVLVSKPVTVSSAPLTIEMPSCAKAEAKADAVSSTKEAKAGAEAVSVSIAKANTEELQSFVQTTYYNDICNVICAMVSAYMICLIIYTISYEMDFSETE